MDVLDHWKKKPLTITVWNPLTGQATNVYTFVGTVPQKVLSSLRSGGAKINHAAEYYGAGKAAKISKTTIVSDYEVFPEDNFMTVREKIYLATGIPVYRQHLCDFETAWTPYNIWTDKRNDINIANVKNDTTAIKGVFVDQKLYSQRSQIRIEAHDTFMLIGKRASRKYTVVDIAVFVTPAHSQLQDAINDKYLGELIYWGFVAKYWPTMSQDAFNAYIRDESKMSVVYPDMATPKRELEIRYRGEREIVSAKYHGVVRAKNALEMNFAITQFTAAIISVSVKLNLRNIFDQTRVSPQIPEIRAWLPVGNERVMVQRQHITAPAIEFPALELFRRGITFAIMIRDQPSTQYLWLSIHPNGKYYMRSTYREEDGMNFCDVYEMLRVRVKPIIDSINQMGRIAFALGSKIESLKTDKLIYQGLNIALFWRQTVTIPAFKKIRESWDKYINAGIVAPKSTSSQDRIDLVFRKGIYEYDPEQIDRVLAASVDVDNRNQYSYLSNPNIHSKWMINYGGRTLSVSMRDTDIRIDIVDIREDEFIIFRDYVYVHFWTLSQDSNFTSLLRKVEFGTDRRLRRLREQDPKLYNLSQLGSDRNYSKICQGVRQPSVYDRREMEKLSARDRASLTKYWNFTKDEPAWYGCPDGVHKHIGFIVGVHPAGWCMPCCNKKQKDNAVTQSCLTERSFGVEASGSRHVMVYGKEVPIERLSHMKTDVAGLFSGGTYYLEGTEQQTAVPDYNIVFAVARVLGMTAGELAQKLARGLTESFYDYAIDLCAGYSRAAVIAQLIETPHTSRLEWREIQTRLIFNLFNIGVVLFMDISDTTIVYMPQIVIDASPSRIVYLMQTQRGFVYPIVNADNVAYSRDGTVRSRVFDAAEKPFVGLRAGAEAQRHGERFDLETVRKFEDANTKIVRKYVNLRNLCYAVMFSTARGHVYLSIDYSSHRPDGIEISTDALQISEIELSGDAALAFASENDLATKEIMTPRDSNYSIIVLENDKHMYVNAGTRAHASTRTRVIDYNPVEINRAILSRAVAAPGSANAELYRQSIYNIILMTLSEEFDKERDNAMRERILRTAAAGEIETLQGILPPIDYFIIQTTLRFSGVKGLRQNLSYSFDFDKVSLQKIQQSSREDALKIIQSLLKDTIVEGEPNLDTIFPNMYTTCKINPTQPFCKGAKLIVRDLASYIDVIADDLRNPLLTNVIFSELWSNTIIDELHFNANPDDKITVYKL